MGNCVSGFPRSIALDRAAVWISEKSADTTTELAAARQAVQDAPRSPGAWLALGVALADSSEHIRHARFLPDMTPQETATVSRIYPEAMQATRHALALDPLYAIAWRDLAEVAAFNGDIQVMEEALGKGMRLSHYRYHVYQLAIQMCGPQWYNDPARALKIAHLAIADPLLSASQMTSLGYMATGGDPATQATALRQRRGPHRRCPAPDADNASAHYDRGTLLMKQHTLLGAVPEYQAASRPRRTGPRPTMALPPRSTPRSRDADAVAEYQEAVRLDPDYADAHADLAYALKSLGQFDQAEHEAQEALRWIPRSAVSYYVLGDLFLIQKQRAPAIAQFRQAVTCDPNNYQANTRLLALLDEDKQYDEALAAGRRIVTLYPTDVNAWDDISDIYLNLKQWDNSLAASGQALAVNPNDALGHENHAEALFGRARPTRPAPSGSSSDTGSR